MDHTVQDQGRDFYVTSIGFRGCFLSPLPFHCTTEENAERNRQTDRQFQVVELVLEVANKTALKHASSSQMTLYSLWNYLPMWFILKTGAKFSNAVSQTPIYDRHMHSHTHTRKTSTHWGPGDQRVIPTHQKAVLVKKLQKSAKEFSQPRAVADLAKQGPLYILIKVSTVQWTLWPSLFTLLLTCWGFRYTCLKCQHPLVLFLSI